MGCEHSTSSIDYKGFHNVKYAPDIVREDDYSKEWLFKEKIEQLRKDNKTEYEIIDQIVNYECIDLITKKKILDNETEYSVWNSQLQKFIQINYE